LYEEMAMNPNSIRTCLLVIAFSSLAFAAGAGWLPCAECGTSRIEKKYAIRQWCAFIARLR